MPEREISPETRVTAPAARWGALAVALVGVTGIVVATYVSLTSSLTSHLGDEHRHLDRNFVRHHGPPVGERDLDKLIWQVDGVRRAVDGLRGEVERAAAEGATAPRRR